MPALTLRRFCGSAVPSTLRSKEQAPGRTGAAEANRFWSIRGCREVSTASACTADGGCSPSAPLSKHSRRRTTNVVSWLGNLQNSEHVHFAIGIKTPNFYKLTTPYVSGRILQNVCDILYLHNEMIANPSVSERTCVDNYY